MKKIKFILNDNGFTIVEIFLAVVITAIVLTIITSMIIQTFNVFDSNTRRMSAAQLAELATTEISGHLRTATSYFDEDNLYEDEDSPYFGDPLTNEWHFDGYYSDLDNNVKFIISRNGEKLNISIENGISENRTIINNVDEFYINEINPGEFEIFIKVNDGENIAQKRITVNSRNL